MEMEGMLATTVSHYPGKERTLSYVANSPCYSALLAGGRSLICLTFDAYLLVSDPKLLRCSGERLTQVHNVVSADSTVVDDDIPSP
jgi:hypothetical protein